MRFASSRHLLPLLGLSLLLGAATACSKSKSDDVSPNDSPGELKYTYSGTTYTVTAATEVSAVYEASTDRVLITATPAGKPGISLALTGLTGPTTRTLARGSIVDNPTSVAQLTRYDAATSLKPAFNALYGPAATNGQITVTQYDRAAGKLVGTFSFTGGPVNGTGATGTAVVSGGTFNFTKITVL